VLEPSSKEYNFRSIAEWNNKPIKLTDVFLLLEVLEIDDKGSKPFTLFQAGGLGVVTGICK